MSDGVYIPCTAGVFIPAPARPQEPSYEDEGLPDQKHDWDRDYDYDRWPPKFPCKLCDSWTYDYDNDGENATDCLRQQASERNDTLKRRWEMAINKWEHQMEYFNSVIAPMGM